MVGSLALPRKSRMSAFSARRWPADLPDRLGLTTDRCFLGSFQNEDTTSGSVHAWRHAVCLAPKRPNEHKELPFWLQGPVKRTGNQKSCLVGSLCLYTIYYILYTRCHILDTRCHILDTIYHALCYHSGSCRILVV